MAAYHQGRRRDRAFRRAPALGLRYQLVVRRRIRGGRDLPRRDVPPQGPAAFRGRTEEAPSRGGQATHAQAGVRVAREGPRPCRGLRPLRAQAARTGEIRVCDQADGRDEPGATGSSRLQALRRRLEEALVRDPRAERLAELITGYSLRASEGQVMRIDGEATALPLAVGLYHAAIRRGALPYLQIRPDGLDEILFAEGNDEQLAFISEGERMQTDAVDAWATIWTSGNTRALTRVPPDRRRIHLSAHYRMVNRRWQRVATGELELCGTLFPTQSHAQDAEMSLTEYEDFVYAACHVASGDDAIAHWKS